MAFSTPRTLWSNRGGVARWMTKNALALAAPELLARIRHHSGRGKSVESAEQAAGYFRTVFAEYQRILAQSFPAESGEFVVGSNIVEYGPGDCLGVGLLAVAAGASRVTCVDRFELLSEHSSIYRALLEGMTEDERLRALACFRHGDPSAGLDAGGPLRYQVNQDGVSAIRGRADLIWSRSTLEHVHRPKHIQHDIATSLRPLGRFIHKIDLSSHGMFGGRESMEFLTLPPSLWGLMTSHSGNPNRLRRSEWKALAEGAGLRVASAITAEEYSAEELERVRSQLAKPYRQLSDEELRCRALWLVGDRPN